MCLRTWGGATVSDCNGIILALAEMGCQKQLWWQSQWEELLAWNQPVVMELGRTTAWTLESL
jgi:hypothetical protein